MAKGKDAKQPPEEGAHEKVRTDGALRVDLDIVDMANEVLKWEQQKLPAGKRRALTMARLFSPRVRPVIEAAHRAMRAEQAERDSARNPRPR